ARDRKTFRAGKAKTGRFLAIAPGIAGAGIEQNAYGCEVDRNARVLDRISSEICRQRLPAVDPSGRKVTPAAVIRDFQIGIGFARDGADVSGNRRNALGMDGKMRRATVCNPAINKMASFADGVSAEKPGERWRGSHRLGALSPTRSTSLRLSEARWSASPFGG